MTSPILETRELVKQFQIGSIVTRAVAGVALSVAEGEFVAIDGRSGSGKSTLLHMLSLLDRPSSGSLFVAGEDVASFSHEQRVFLRLSMFGYVFQDYALIPELTALENVMLPLFMKTGCFGSCSKRGVELLDQVGLSARMGNLPSQLSGGEQQRVAIARALVNSPKVFFADEPTANLDTDTSETIMGIIEGLHRDGITILLVTHEPEYALRAQRKITLVDGRVV